VFQIHRPLERINMGIKNGREKRGGAHGHTLAQPTPLHLLELEPDCPTPEVP
jgi:hypothetical protein